ncbi:MAG: tetratricopeptide repeat protein [Streptosporangiaceae bacterium]|nr:tetratricopeptide repeat protein [Streptosporangiaceae bacterium]MBV9856237.1 tetratricopeptide repeat protein [Streptosporangiaceae bacterium]
MPGAEDFDEIEFQAARTGNHLRAAVRMSDLARTAAAADKAAAADADAAGISRAEAYLRAGDQWLMADDPQRAADEFSRAIADGGQTFADPRVPLARAYFALGKDAEAESLISALRAEQDKATPRTCDLLAELLADQGDLPTALEWATMGVEQYLSRGENAEMQLLLRLRYRIRNDLGLGEDDYDRMLDSGSPAARGGRGPQR